jgi:hypothetical protein
MGSTTLSARYTAAMAECAGRCPIEAGVLGRLHRGDAGRPAPRGHLAEKSPDGPDARVVLHTSAGAANRIT